MRIPAVGASYSLHLPSLASAKVQPACEALLVWNAGHGFDGGQVLLEREEPEEEAGMVNACLTRDLCDFADVHRPTEDVQRDDRELDIA